MRRVIAATRVLGAREFARGGHMPIRTITTAATKNWLLAYHRLELCKTWNAPVADRPCTSPSGSPMDVSSFRPLRDAPSTRKDPTNVSEFPLPPFEVWAKAGLAAEKSPLSTSRVFRIYRWDPKTGTNPPMYTGARWIGIG